MTRVACHTAYLSLRVQASQAPETPVPCPLPWVFQGHTPRGECIASPAQPSPSSQSVLRDSSCKKEGAGSGRQAPPGARGVGASQVTFGEMLSRALGHQEGMSSGHRPSLLGSGNQGAKTQRLTRLRDVGTSCCPRWAKCPSTC